MATMTFQINDASTGGTNPAVWITVTENANGTLAFNVTQEGGVIGDLRGLFFDVSDESILGSLKVISTSTDVRIGDDSIKDLGDGANMNGLLGSDKGYDVGIEVGSAGIGKGDDIRSYSFSLDSTARDLTLADVANVDFAARLTSVGMIGGTRADSSKILEITSQAIDARFDLVIAEENTFTNGNLLTNDVTAGGGNTVTSWSAGSVGGTVMLESEGDAVGLLRLTADGGYTLDTSMGDRLSEGESIVYNYTYGVRNQTETTSWSDDVASMTVIVNGKNDGPVAGNDLAYASENGDVTSGTVLANDSDIDRLDTISVVSWTGGDLGRSITINNGAGASVTLNADGSYALDAVEADALSAGETVTQSFEYVLSDNHGATDVATFSVTVTGENDGPEALDDVAGSVIENGQLSGSVATNDGDVDRLDTHTWAIVDGSFSGRGALTMSSDGTWSYVSGGTYDYLNEGEALDLTFQYIMTDNHGASDTANVSFTVVGVGVVTPPNPQDPSLEYLFNHGSGAYDHGFFPQSGHDNTAEGFTSNDTLKIAGYGDADDLTITEGNYGLGDLQVDDTMFVVGIDGNRHSTRTEDVGYLVDYTGLTADQINVTGNQDIEIVFA